jgi:hypothetical protein
MQDIEPYYNWRHLYIASEDPRSPFFGRDYSEFEYSNTIYNFYIHPQWDDINSETLYIKILFVDYDEKYAIIELIGEWNDAINNDIMLLKRDIVDELNYNGINKYIVIGENVLNFHNSDDSYYEEWFEDNGTDGWIAFVGFRDHVLKEFNIGFRKRGYHLPNAEPGRFRSKEKPTRMERLVYLGLAKEVLTINEAAFFAGINSWKLREQMQLMV